MRDSVNFDLDIAFIPDTEFLNPLPGFSAPEMAPAFGDYRSLLLEAVVVARDRIELPTRGFSGSVKSITY